MDITLTGKACEGCGQVVYIGNGTSATQINADGSPHNCPAAGLPLFDLEAGEKGKEIGMARAAGANQRQDFLVAARAVADDMAQQKGHVTADDVVAWFDRWGIDLPTELGNAMGCIFKSEHLTWKGETTKSKRPGRHANMIKVWGYKA